MLNNKKGHYLLMECLFSGIVTFLIMMVLYVLKDFAPFGDNSFACMDANIQYLDFFSYFKEVLSGNDSIVYSFSKVLGGSTFGIYSYNLVSPFNLLVVFFEKSDIHSFFDMVVALKLALAAVFCTVFLHFRFRDRDQKDTFKTIILVLLSISYALGQYSIAQASNILWLDGVYMLPLILLGIYGLVNQQKSTMLSVCVACTIILNWYIGAMNCLFAISSISDSSLLLQCLKAWQPYF